MPASDLVIVDGLHSDSPTPSTKTVLLSPDSAVTQNVHMQNPILPTPEHVEPPSEQAANTPTRADVSTSSHAGGTPILAQQKPPSPHEPTESEKGLPTVDIPDSHPTADPAIAGLPTEDKSANSSSPGSVQMMQIYLPQGSGWESDFEPIPPRRTPQPAIEQVQTRGRKKGRTTLACTKVPPEPIVPREERCDPISVGKLVWILHDQFPLIVVAQGKAGIAWRTKSNKLGAQCTEGHQWIQVQRIFKHSVPLLFPEPEVGCSVLESALPPSQGRHRSIMWSSRHLISYKP